ncbi:hypothetical protein [Brucella pseudogrignonensis]|uniref:hypothetical protein n=1 Tax=Brucella pseudogrignonensis TaxID=419475 RepID=UPI000B9997E2|nr:hypothetical protein [Brucella pseudogrignonensis]
MREGRPSRRQGGRALAFSEGDRPTNDPARQWRRPTDFRRRASPPLQRETNQPGFAIKALRQGSGCPTGSPVGFRRHEGRDGRGPDDGASHVRA